MLIKFNGKKTEIKLLGININGKEQAASKTKTNEAMKCPISNNVTELRRFLGMNGLLSNFIKDCAVKTEHLTNGLKGKGKKWSWSVDMEK